MGILSVADARCRSRVVRDSGRDGGAIANEQLMFQQQRLRSDGANSTWLEESRKGDQQMDGENEEVADRQNRTTTISARKTAQPARR